MKHRITGRNGAIWMAILMMGTGSAAMAAIEPLPPASSSPNGAALSSQSAVVSLEASDRPLKDTLTDLSKQAKVNILVESGVDGQVTARFTNQPLDHVLSLILGARGPVWMRVDAVMQQDTFLPDEPLYNLARATNALGVEKMTFGLPDGKGSVVVGRGSIASMPPAKEGFRRAVLYVVARRSAAASNDIASPGGVVTPVDAPPTPAASATESVARFTDLSQQRYGMLQSMSPGERKQAMQNDILQILQLPPAARMQMLQEQREAMRSLPPEVQTQYRQQMREAWQILGGGPARGRRPATEGTTRRPTTPTPSP